MAQKTKKAGGCPPAQVQKTGPDLSEDEIVCHEVRHQETFEEDAA